jgi:hypothetical protein
MVLIDEIDDETGEPIGRAEHQGPDVDGATILPPGSGEPGDLVEADVVASEGVDLRAVPVAGSQADGIHMPEMASDADDDPAKGNA